MHKVHTIREPSRRLTCAQRVEEAHFFVKQSTEVFSTYFSRDVVADNHESHCGDVNGGKLCEPEVYKVYGVAMGLAFERCGGFFARGKFLDVADLVANDDLDSDEDIFLSARMSKLSKSKEGSIDVFIVGKERKEGGSEEAKLRSEFWTQKQRRDE